MRVAKALEEVADGFALLDMSDALMLREAGASQPILLLEGFFSAGDLEACAEYGVIPAVHRVEQLQMIREAALPIRHCRSISAKYRHEPAWVLVG